MSGKIFETGLHYPISLSTLPTSWTYDYVGAFTESIESGFACGAHNQSGEGIQHLRPMNISSGGKIELGDARHVSADFNPKRLRENDVLFNNTNSPPLVGKTAVIGATAAGKAFSNHMTRVVFSYAVEPLFAARQLHFLFSSGYFLHRCVKHVNQASISSSDLGRTVPLVVPPLPEQKRIVAKIEELFSELEAGEASLRKARRQLGVYRQSLLKQAFEGKLTQKWRTQNPDKLESPASLLARIQSERQDRYNLQLKGWELDEKSGAKPRKPKDFESISEENLSSLLSLPHGWTWVRFGNLLAISSGNGLTAHQMKAGPYPVYGGNGVSGYHSTFMFQEPRLVIGRVGAKCGITHITPPNSWVTDNALVCEFQIESINMEFVKLQLNHLDLNKLSVSTAQPVVSGSKLNPLPIPLCSLPEQQEIVRLLDEQFEAIERNERELDAALQRSEALRQAILKKAFSGRLVPQDPADEPAATLLARLRTERASMPSIKRKSSLP